MGYPVFDISTGKPYLKPKNIYLFNKLRYRLWKGLTLKNIIDMKTFQTVKTRKHLNDFMSKTMNEKQR